MALTASGDKFWVREHETVIAVEVHGEGAGQNVPVGGNQSLIAYRASNRGHPAHLFPARPIVPPMQGPSFRALPALSSGPPEVSGVPSSAPRLQDPITAPMSASPDIISLMLAQWPGVDPVPLADRPMSPHDREGRRSVLAEILSPPIDADALEIIVCS